VRTRHHSLLHDTGPGFPDGGSGLLPVLAAAGVTELDALVVSHGDLDHAGGAGTVLAAHPRARLWSSGFTVPGHGARDCVAGRGWWWDGHRFEFLHPAAARPKPGNDDSCVLRITGPGGRVLFTGDIGRNVEARLAAAGLVDHMDLVLAAHHGSRTSSDRTLIAAARPRYVVFSAGYGNRWGFPVSAVLEDWLAGGACVLSTATGGSLHFSGGPERSLALVRRHRVDGAGPWRRGPSPCRPEPGSPVQPSHPGAVVD
jgi:competence protein ComEC